MDNQKDQFGTTPDQTNASRNTNANNPTAAPTASGASAASRKSAPMPSASDSTSNLTSQSTAATPNAQSQNTANAGTNRQGEGQQTNDQEGTLLDTALNSGKKWIEDSGVLNSVNQLPQSLKDLGNRALDRVNGLSTTQKVVGGAILAAGIGWLATRKGKSSGSSDSSAYNYGRQRDAGSYGRKSYGYQAPDASASRRTDSGSPYGNSGSRFGSSGSYNTDASSASNTGIKAGSGRDDSGAAYGHASARTDHGSQSSSSTDYKAKSTDYRSIE
ncbi:hypothetical protein MON38_13040 [Hymenobacter sp. DH14]|uniref:Uncharacterized protein n=1 Tax=Hymenobacter cyanobacteriorum TaxID=2926463 RepID=A0A9X2AI84_9BACT|nr:hypothetical protein [Hymenobacter cyanobacteriorum]MCI1188350.1 hypothetical protein [Hymenobacter cyanobacteriorum]